MASAEQRYDFFVSYTAVNEPWALWVAEQLEDRLSRRVTLQAWHFRAGDNFVAQMHSALRNSNQVILVLSQAYLDSRFSTEEWQSAWASASGRLLPIRIDDVSPSGLLGPIVYVDFVGCSETECLDRLARALAPKGRTSGSPFPGASTVPQRSFGQRFPGPLDHAEVPAEGDAPAADAVAAEISTPRLFNVLPARRGQVPRTAETEAIVDLVVNTRITSIVGFGGCGKSVIASDVARMEAIARRFPDGVVWVTASLTAAPDQLAKQLLQQIAGTLETIPLVPYLTQVATLMADKRILVIVDDVWPGESSDQVDALVGALPSQSSMLVTTRGAPVPSSAIFELGDLSTAEGVEVLLASTHTTLSDHREATAIVKTATDIVSHVRGWALLLGIISARVRRLKGQALLVALRSEVTALRVDQLAGVDDTSRGRALDRTIDRSLEALGERRPFFELLRLYPADTVMLHDMLQAVWAVDSGVAIDLMSELTEAGLARWRDVPGDVGIVLHDLVVDYLHSRFGGPSSCEDVHSRISEVLLSGPVSTAEIPEALAPWMGYHVALSGSAGRKHRLTTKDWRQKLLTLTGSDAAFLRNLEDLRRWGSPSAGLAFRALSLEALVRHDIVAQPREALEVQAAAGSLQAALLQARERGSGVCAVMEASRLEDRTDQCYREAARIAGLLFAPVESSVELADTCRRTGCRSALAECWR